MTPSMPPQDERDALTALLGAVDAQAEDLLTQVAERPRVGTLLGMLATEGLSDVDVALVLVTLSERLGGRPHLTGEELAKAAALGQPGRSAARLATLARLAEGSPLVAVGLLIPDAPPAHPADALQTAYRVADRVLRAAAEVFGNDRTEARRPPRGAYRSNGELLADLRRLSLHYRRRAARVFDLDPWTGTGIEAPDAVDPLVRAAREAAAHVAGRMSASDESLPLMRLKNAHRLDVDSMVVLVTLLFQEVLEGVAVVDAVDLVRLVSDSEDELLRRRQMLRPLERAGLLRLEGAYAGKDLTADASLPNQVIDAMVGSTDALGADEKLDFHAWLQDLDGSDHLFFDLGDDGP